MWPAEHTWESEPEPPARCRAIIEATTHLFAGGNPADPYASQTQHRPLKAVPGQPKRSQSLNLRGENEMSVLLVQFKPLGNV